MTTPIVEKITTDIVSKIGAALVSRDGKLLGRGHNMRVQKGSAIHHVRTSCWRFKYLISDAIAKS